MSTSSILVINGPNLNLLGSREPNVYGSATLDAHMAATVASGVAHGFEVDCFQSNSESQIVAAVQGANEKYGALIVNAGALTHYSWSLHDALRSFSGKIIEVHLSNPSARESFRHTSVLAGVVDGSISGFGGLGYVLAIQALVALK